MTRQELHVTFFGRHYTVKSYAGILSVYVDWLRELARRNTPRARSAHQQSVLQPSTAVSEDGQKAPLMTTRGAAFLQQLHVADLADQYISRIRQPETREYARAYLHALLAGRPAPERPAGLSSMAARAVRLTLDDYRRTATRDLDRANHDDLSASMRDAA